MEAVDVDVADSAGGHDLATRAALHAALGEPVRLAIVDELVTSDRSPGELAARLDMAPNLLAFHLDVLERVGLVRRTRSDADGRRRYVRLVRHRLDAGAPPGRSTRARVMFVCTHNSARSQLAAALWRRHTGRDARSAGTHPAAAVHPGALAAAERVRLDLRGARPRGLSDDPGVGVDLVVTVCDRAHEELDPPPEWWHWSIPDPVPLGVDDAFDAALRELDERIGAVTDNPVRRPVPGGTP